VSGSVSRDGEATFAPFLVLPDGFVDVPPGSTGSYRLVLKDGQGAELSESGFDLSFWQTDPDPGMLDEAYFVLRLEWLEDTQTIELRDATGRVLAVRSVSPTFPEVEIVEPAGGTVTAPSSVAVRWRATDPDGDALSYSLAVSEDGGATWQTVATRLQGTVYHLPVSGFHAGTDYLVRVRVTDGVNTAKDVTDASFQVMRGIPRTMLAGALAGFVVLGVVGIALLSLGVWRLGQIRRRRKVS